MKWLIIWFDWWQAQKSRIEGPDAHRATYEEAHTELDNLLNAMRHNKPRGRGKNLPFELYVYTKMLQDVGMTLYQVKQKLKEGDF